MKKSALIVLIAALAVVLVCTGLGAAYLMTNQNNGLALEGEGDTFREEVVIDGLAPGQERACSYRGESASPASLVVSLTADDGARSPAFSPSALRRETRCCMMAGLRTVRARNTARTSRVNLPLR